MATTTSHRPAFGKKKSRRRQRHVSLPSPFSSGVTSMLRIASAILVLSHRGCQFSCTQEIHGGSGMRYIMGVVALISPSPYQLLRHDQNQLHLGHCLHPQGFGGGSGGGTTATKSKKKKTTKKSKQQQQQLQNEKSKLPSTSASTTSRYSPYQPPSYQIPRASLEFDIQDSKTIVVTTNMTITPNDPHSDLVLDGDASRLDLREVRLLKAIEGTDDDEYVVETSTPKILKRNEDYKVDSTKLTISHQQLSNGRSNISAPFVLQTIVQAKPSTQELSGLFCKDGSSLLTHCEPTGFSQITYWFDRPDILTIFDRVKIVASQKEFPLLLSNGNRFDSSLDDDSDKDPRHSVVYHDPHPKPAYIFGLVAAKNLKPCVTGTYLTRSGRQIQLTIYSEDNEASGENDRSSSAKDNRLQFAMDTLKRAMEWDETKYGLEYDLDEYNIVASQQFHIGAMENKGLNIFQTSLIATHPNTTTDVTYDLVEKTIAHEYLHNWSGNRVTVESWREFGLKEGLTVFRDQEFTADVGLRTTVRIEAVKILREKQFREDALSMRHAVRPPTGQVSSSNLISETTLDALATSTTYHKSAEIIRMFKTIVGEDGFKSGIKLYFERHDGSGATWDDFRDAMADANSIDLDQFGLWYSTAGTPTVSYSYKYSKESRKFSLTLHQNLECNPDMILHIPVAVGLMDKSSGSEIRSTTVLNLKTRTETFEFDDIQDDVVPSILRDFSAPVILVTDDLSQQEIDLAFLATFDTDGFNRWESIQKLFSKCIFATMSSDDFIGSDLCKSILSAFENTLKDSSTDAASKAYLLRLPSEAILSRQLETDDPVGVHEARLKLGQYIHSRYKSEIRDAYDKLAILQMNDDGTDALSRANRSLCNVLLEYICFSDSSSEAEVEAAEIAMNHFEKATCLTEKLEAFRCLASMTGTADSFRDDAIDKFYQYAVQNGPMVMNKWFQVQALADLPDVLSRVQSLTQHPDFKATNAGRFRSLITSFTMNASAFHTEGGYKFIGSVISQMDRVSPQLAAELTNKFACWPKHEPSDRATLMKNELRRILGYSSSTTKKTSVSRHLSAVARKALDG